MNDQTPARHFLGWEQPFLQAAAVHLLTAHAHDGLADLGDIHVFVPGRRAGRRLLDYLVAEAEQQGTGLIPPQILPVGEFITTFAAAPELPLAGTLQRGLAWMRALHATSRPTLELLFSPQQSVEISREKLIWPLATSLDQLQVTVAAGGYDFAAIAARLRDLPAVPPQHAVRWQALAALQADYRRVLENAGLQDPEQHKLQAVAQGLKTPAAPVVLAGIIDMSPLAARAARQLATQLQVLVYAPESRAAAFDDLGLADAAWWTDATLVLDETRLVQVSGARDQAHTTAALLAAAGINDSPASATLVCPDPALVPELDLAVATQLPRIALHNPQRRRLQSAPPVHLLVLLAGYLRTPDFAALAALLRHPDMVAALQTQEMGPAEHWPALLDLCHAEHLGCRNANTLLQDGQLKPEQQDMLRRVVHALQHLLEPAASVSDIHSAATWLEALFARLYTGHFDQHLPDDRPYVRGFEALQQALGELEAAAPLWMKIDAAGAIDLVRAWIGDGFMPDEPASHEVDVVGFLEAYLDDAPLVVVTSLSEGLVPEHFGADAFLPGTLRTQLGLPDSRSRYVRDACIVETLCLDTSRQAVFLSARQAPDGSPQMLSRLALTGADPEVIARRLLRHSEAPTVLVPGQATAQTPGLVKRMDATELPPTTMSVTSFKTYLENPWFFYLRHVLRLESPDDAARELDGRLFGTIAHDVLERFGRSDAATETDPGRIQAALADILQDDVAQRFGPTPAPVIAVQLRRLRMRLDRFAEWQAAQVQAGWSIVDCEYRIPFDQVALPLPGGTRMGLRGRIDRIDRHADGRYRIIDYKTSDTEKPPRQTHFDAENNWIDLQLPLYDFAWRQQYPEAIIELGYVALCKDLEKIDYLPATGLRGRSNKDMAWDLEGAIACATDVADRVRRGLFPDLREQHPSGQYAQFAALRGPVEAA